MNTSTAEKTAVLAPMPKAKDNTATAIRPGLLRMVRRA
jgi:hypothetical protein